MSKLIYVWYHKYGEYVRNTGISLSKEYIVKTVLSEDTGRDEYVEVSVEVKKNTEYLCPPDFYGKNIDGITAIVGENGSGKTTIARMLIDYPVGSLVRKPPFFWVEISGEGDIRIYCHEVSIKSKGKVQVKEWQTNELAAVYMSSMFNFSELSGHIGLDELRENFQFKRQIYSPAGLLKYAREKAAKEQYGYMAEFPNNKYLVALQAYARSMEHSDIQAYIKLQEELVLEGYRKTSEEIRRTLDIFQWYEFEIREFASDVVENTATEEGKVIFEMKKFYSGFREKAVLDGKNDFWDNIYAICVAEVFLASGNVNADQIEPFSINHSSLNENSVKELRLLLDNLIKSVREMDMGWRAQIEECLIMLEKYCAGKYRDWKQGPQKFEDSPEMVEWYYEELIKPTSFFKRNLRFRIRSSSTGELALLNLFSYIVDAALKNPRVKKFLLVIDEIDAGLHPRWQQKIIKYLRDFLESFEGYRFQVIITSHSPIILSDMLKEHVIKIKKGADGFLQLMEMSEPTFGANIAMQYLDSFYMDEGNIGDLAKEKIRELIKDIRDLKSDDTEKERILRYLADSIGEEMVRKKLQRDLNRKKPEYISFMEQWEKCSDEERRKILDYMEQQNRIKEQG